MRRLFVLGSLVIWSSHCFAQATTELKNWFNDPFFQVSSGVPDCPLPLGPLLTEEQRRTQAHSRAEKGTSCRLAGQCERPNYYDYDQDIAAAFKSEAAANTMLFKHTSLWVTIQARVVFIEGCASSRSAASALEAFARRLPNVQQAIAFVRTDPKKPAPYAVKP